MKHLCLLLASAVALAEPALADPSNMDEARTRFQQGVELYREGSFDAALAEFQKAYELARTPRTTGQLGLAELAAGYPVEMRRVGRS